MSGPLHNLLIHLPYVGLALGGVESKGATKIIEWVIESAVIGVIVMYGSVQIIGTKLDAVGTQLTRIITVQDADASRLRIVEHNSAVNGNSIRFLLRGKRHEGQ